MMQGSSDVESGARTTQANNFDSPYARYGLAVFAVGTAVTLRVLLSPIGGPVFHTFIFLFTAVGVTAWFGRLGPALLAVALCLGAANWFFTEPSPGLHFDSPENWPAVGVFTVLSLALTGIIQARHRARDRAERERAQRRQLDQRTRLLDLSDDAVFVRDGGERITYWNLGAEKAYGYSREEALGQVTHTLLKTQFPETLAQIFEKLNRDSHWAGELTHTCRDGRRVVMASRWALDRDEHGRTMAVLEINHDITARKQAEAMLREQERQMRLVTDQAAVMLVQCDADCRYKFANARYAERFGIRSEEIVGRHIPDLLGAKAFEQIRPHVDAALRGRLVEFEKTVHYPRTGSRRVHVTYVPQRDSSQRVTGFIGSLQDVTERAETEQALRQSEARTRARAEELAAIMDAVPAITFVANDADCRHMSSNRATREFLRVPEDANVSKSAPPGERPTSFRALKDGRELAPEELPVQRAAATGEEIRDFELTIEFTDGTSRELCGNAVPLFDPKGRVRGAVGAFSDVTERKAVERALRESEERFRKAFDSMPQLVWSADGGGIVDYYNSRIREYGIRPDADGSWNWEEFIHPEDLPKTAAAWEAATGSRTVFSYEHRIRMADGSYRWHLSRGVPILGPEGSIQRWFGTATDIHALHEAQQARADIEERLRLALAGSGMGVWTWDLETDQVEWSPEIYQLFGTPVFEGTAEAFGKFLHPEDSQRVWQGVKEAIAKQSVYVCEFRIVRGDGAVRWVSNRGRAHYHADGRARQMLGVVMDITVQKNAERQIEVARDEAVAASRAKDDFLATLSHELRTPLNPVLLIATEAARDHQLPADVRAHFQMIAKNVALQAGMIDDLLDLNRIVRGKMYLRRAPLQLHALIRDAASALQEDVNAKQIAVKFRLEAESSWVTGDPLRLRQVFWNVLKNAVKFNRAGGTLELVSANPAAHEIDVCVTDSGIGMTPQELARVWEPFAQGDHSLGHTEATYGGLGLGLAITRALVEAQGGQVRAESAGPGKGTTIAIRLPLAAAGERPAEVGTSTEWTAADATGASPDAHVSRRVLLVEDHEPTRTTLTYLLERRGAIVTAAASLAQARTEAERQNFDLILSDLGLPDGDGCALMAEMRTKYPTLIGVAMTGYGMEEDVNRSRAAGFSEHLTKPVSIAALDGVLRRVQDRGTVA